MAQLVLLVALVMAAVGFRTASGLGALTGFVATVTAGFSLMFALGRSTPGLLPHPLMGVLLGAAAFVGALHGGWRWGWVWATAAWLAVLLLLMLVNMILATQRRR